MKKLIALTVFLIVSLFPRSTAADQDMNCSDNQNWGLYNEMSNTWKSNINWCGAQSWVRHKKKIIVAVIDTGVDCQHEGINCLNIGYDFVLDHPGADIDTHGHGTHISGIIEQVEPDVKILPIKFYSAFESGAENLQNSTKAIKYAIKKHVDIINYSGGGAVSDNSEYLALKEAESEGILIVSAAGNEKKNTDDYDNSYYPASYRLSNVISVGSNDIKGNKLKSSNWGKKTVDVFAPGENIYSYYPSNKYGYMSGTSQATAFVSGVAAMILETDPSLTPKQVIKIIKDNVTKSFVLSEQCSSGGIVNAKNALKAVRKSIDTHK